MLSVGPDDVSTAFALIAVAGWDGGRGSGSRRRAEGSRSPAAFRITIAIAVLDVVLPVVSAV